MHLTLKQEEERKLACILIRGGSRTVARDCILLCMDARAWVFIFDARQSMDLCILLWSALTFIAYKYCSSSTLWIKGNGSPEAIAAAALGKQQFKEPNYKN